MCMALSVGPLCCSWNFQGNVVIPGWTTNSVLRCQAVRTKFLIPGCGKRDMHVLLLLF
jgi:hypothetical protein